MSADRPFPGILLMIAFCVLAPMGDSIAKLLGGTIPLVEMLWVRFAVQAVLLVLYARVAGLPLGMSKRVFRLTVLRTLLHIIGIGAMFASLRYLPLADALAIAYVMPFILLLLGRIVFRDVVDRPRLAACTIGFLGTLLVIQPRFAEVGWPALLPLVVAFAFAFFMLVTRAVARETEPISLQAVSGLVATALLSVAFAVYPVTGWEPLVPLLPGPKDALLLIAIGVLGTAAHLAMTWSLRFAPSATVAPVQYVEIAFGTFIGYIVFGDLPDTLAVAGMAVIIAAGIYILLRERAISRALAADTTTI